MEIERKFLTARLPDRLKGFEHCDISQAYLSFEPEMRVRRAGERFYLTVKRGEGLVREETETEISKEEYCEREKHIVSARVLKTRYYIPLEGGTMAELDVYGGKLSGLIAVEVEFDTVEQAHAFTPPDWFGREITDDPAYKNKNLTKLM